MHAPTVYEHNVEGDGYGIRIDATCHPGHEDELLEALLRAFPELVYAIADDRAERRHTAAD